MAAADAAAIQLQAEPQRGRVADPEEGAQHPQDHVRLFDQALVVHVHDATGQQLVPVLHEPQAAAMVGGDGAGIAQGQRVVTARQAKDGRAGIVGVAYEVDEAGPRQGSGNEADVQ